jgi:ABC-type transport system substrate-binding protein
MKKMMALLLSLLIFVISFSLVACDEVKKSEEETAEETTEVVETDFSTPDEFTLAIALTDSLNPYTCKSKQNLILSTLIYDSLITLNNNFEPEYRIAKVFSETGKECRVILKSGVRFSNGDFVTADDVVYSFNQAKKSGRYDGVFDNVTAAGAVSGDVIFTLKNPDPYFKNLLTFPIIQNRSKDKKTSNGRITAPVGSGMYKYNYTADEQTLILNGYYNLTKLPNIKKIRLEDTPDNGAMEYAVSTDKISAWYTEFDDTLPDRIDGEVAQINTSNLFYIGLNQRNEALKEAKVRRAISFAIDRSYICDKLYYEKSIAATGLFHPDFYDADLSHKEFYSLQIDKAVEELKEIGYNNSSSEGVVSKDGKELSLELLVNKNNKLKVQLANTIKEELRLAGITVKVKSVSFDTFMKLVNTCSYDMYIGEIKLGNNLDLTPILDNEKTTANGILSDGCYKKYRQLQLNKITQTKFMTYFEKRMPVIPLFYKCGLFSYSSAISGQTSSAQSNIFSGIENWIYNGAN